ncbi:MAG: hypothetical protein V2J51_07205 [Erythrobacter sp.]|jgi:hypothetical protein|nr:hypothetical protein [Erythrobacter sp.]
MPKYVSQKVAEMHRVTKVPTFMDKVKEVASGFLMFIIIVGAIGAIFS